MGYRKRYEDSYLDDEEEEFDGTDRTDAERIISLLQKHTLDQKQSERLKKLTERLFVGAELPGPPGALAIEGLAQVCNAYKEKGDIQTATALWFRISEVATKIGRSDLYYTALDEIANLDAGPGEDVDEIN